MSRGNDFLSKNPKTTLDMYDPTQDAQPVRQMMKSSSAATLPNAHAPGDDQFFSNRNFAKSIMKSKHSALAALSLQGGFSQTISANTLRNSHSQWSFPKGDRFLKIRIDNNANIQNLPSTLDLNKAMGFGFGEKNGLRCLYGKDSPSANTYKIRGQFDKLRSTEGKSFGLPHSAYAKVYLPDSKMGTSNIEAPGPGAYDIKTFIGANSRKYTLKSRTKAVDSATRDNPPANTYHPNFTLAESHKFSGITFGFGSRISVTGQLKETPGPGTYKISSVFDRFKRLPTREYLQLKENGGGNPQQKYSSVPRNQNNEEL